MERAAYVERVLRIVESIPPGKVSTYGAIADLVGQGGPRQVGRVMSTDGGGVPWWRVVRANGTLGCPRESALDHYRREGTPLRSGGESVDIRKAFWSARDIDD